MKKLNFYLCCILFVISCSKTPEKPKLTIAEYTKQAIVTKGVVEKILTETDYKKMHEIALAVESSRAVNCITVDEECNIFGELLNRIVNSTQNSLPKEEDNKFFYKKLEELDQAIQKGHVTLGEQWRIYIKAKEQQ